MISQANTRLGLDLYAHLVRTSPGANVFFSPLSVATVLTMALEGARGRTAREMRVALRLGAQPALETVHSETAALLGAIQCTDDRAAESEIRQRVEVLRQQHEDLIRAMMTAMGEGGWEQHEEIAVRDSQVVSELNRLLAEIDQYELSMANGLWGSRSCAFRPGFLETVARHYGDGTIDTACDFENDPESERHRINRWVAEQTTGRIEELLSEDALHPLTRLVLISAIYFRGQWATPFKECHTRDENFTAGRGAVRVAMMSGGGRVGYAAFNPDGTPFETPARVASRDRTTDDKYPGAGGWQVLEKPYRGEQVSMVLVLPVSDDGLEPLERRLSVEALGQWTAALEERKAYVTLPRFRLETTYLLADTLAALGMTSAFERPGGAQGADFSGMSESRDTMNRLYIDRVIHRAFVEVNEKGTEAAVATGLGGTLGIPKMIDFVPRFRADHPFLFMIRHRETGALLFLGRVVDPST